MTTIVLVLFLVLYGGAAVLLTNTAHKGALLVHEFGVTAMLDVPATRVRRFKHLSLRPIGTDDS
jgi:hypothetical protein